MAREKYIELITQEIDGANSPKESARLKEYLAADPDAQALFNDLAAASNMLKEVREIEPSPRLKRNILNAIQPDKHAAMEKQHARRPQWSFRQSLESLLLPKVTVKYAFAFALGLLGGILIYSLLVDNIHKTTPSNISDLYGTIALRGSSGSFEKEERVEIEPYGTISLKYSKDLVFAELNLETSQEIVLALEFDENDLGFDTFTKLKSPANNSISVSGNSLKLTNFGENKYVIFFIKKTPAPAPIGLKVFSAGDLLLEKTILVAK